MKLTASTCLLGLVAAVSSCKKPAAASVASIQLNGTFKSACLAAAPNYQLKTIIMASGSPVSMTDEVYKDSSCTTLLQSTVQTPSSVHIVVAQGAGEVPENVDFALKQALTTVADSAQLQTLKAANTCGLANAQLSQQVDVTSCYPAVFYDLWLAKADNTLTLGLVDSAHDGKAPEHRPTDFDRAGILRLGN